MTTCLRAVLAASLAATLLAPQARTQTLQVFSPAADKKSHLIVFADGGVKQVVSQPKDATASTGSLGMTYQGQNFIVSSLVNVFARGDTITKGYGASMLPPASGAAENSALLDVRWVGFAQKLLGADCSVSDPGYVCALALHGYLT